MMLSRGSMLSLIAGAAPVLAARSLKAVAYSPSEAQDPPHGDYFGLIEGLAGGLIAVSTNGTAVLAYLCDGSGHAPTVAQWFRGTVAGRAIALHAPNGARLQATAGARGVAGHVTLANGRTFAFSARKFEALSSPHQPGLYRSTKTVGGTKYVGGWIAIPQSAGALLRGGAVLDQKTGAVLASGSPDFGALRAFVPGLGTFVLKGIGGAVYADGCGIGYHRNVNGYCVPN
jgi:hypothetical protein